MKNILKKIWHYAWRIAVLIFLINLLLILIFRFIPIPITPLMVLRCYEQVMDGKDMKLQKDWVALEEMSPNMVLAVMAAEDQKFMMHNGFDFEAIEKAISHNEKSKRIKGASTISQQTAKNVFLWPGRSWFRKGLEVYFTFMIELLWSKERIMEVYLNIIEMGKGVYGVQAAAQFYFHKDASKLSRSEAALIAAILPRPLKWSVLKPSAFILKKQQNILSSMGQLGRIDFLEELEEARKNERKKKKQG